MNVITPLQNFGPFLADVTLKATILLTLTAVIAAASRRASAAWRHLVWMLGLIATLALPLLTGMLPSLRVSLPQAPPFLTAPIPAQPNTIIKTAVQAVTNAKAVAASTPTVAAAPAPQTVPSDPAARLRGIVAIAIFLAWLAGVGIMLAQWTIGSLGLHRIFQATSVISLADEGAIAATYRAAERALPGRSYPVAVRLASDPEAVRTPLTWGWLYPIIALPAEAKAWSEERLRAALLHELAHIRRRDWLQQRLAHMACVLFWFHPLVWLAARTVRLESESASDDLVIAAGMPAAAYADQLLQAVHALRERPGIAFRQETVAMVSSRPSGIEARLRAVLSPNQSRRPLTSRLSGTAILAALLLTLPLAALRPVALAQEGADPLAGPGVLVRNVGGITQYISKDYLRAVTRTKDGNINRLAEYDRAARDNAPARAVSGYKTTLANGYTVEIVGLVRLAERNNFWQYADPHGWHKPDGTPLAKPAAPGGPMIQSGMFAKHTGGIAPVLMVTRVTPPTTVPRSGFSAFVQPLGLAQDEEYSWIVPHGDAYGPEDTSMQRFTYALFPRGTPSFTLRVGIGTGSWTTRAVKRVAFTPEQIFGEKSNVSAPTPIKQGSVRHRGTIDVIIKVDDRPAIEYTDSQGHLHNDYFLADQKMLGAEDRRIVAVDTTGKTFPLDTRSMSGGLWQFGVPVIGLAFTPPHEPNGLSSTESSVPLGTIRELRLETRPFQRVDLQNIPLPPQPGIAVTNR